MELEMPYSWDFIKQFNFSHPPTSPFSRNHTVEENYSKHGIEIKKSGGVEAYLKKKYLSSDNDFNMTPNNFPYDMAVDSKNNSITVGEDFHTKNFGPGLITKIRKDII